MKSYLLLAAIALCFGTLHTSSIQAQTTNTPIYACYQKENGNLRRVSGPGQCKKEEIQLSWNAAGVPGPPGQSVTSVEIPLGDARCPNGVGGVQYTDSTGTRVVCNGQQGEPGGAGSTDVYYKQNLGTVDLVTAPNTGGFVELITLTLPEGSYLVSATSQLRYIPGATVTDRSLIQCVIRNGTLDQEFRVLESSPPPPGNPDFLVNATMPITFGAGGGTMRWECSANPKDTAYDVTARKHQIWAIKASALHIQ